MEFAARHQSELELKFCVLLWTQPKYYVPYTKTYNTANCVKELVDKDTRPSNTELLR